MKEVRLSPVTVRVAAKVNLQLSVGAPRPDGFHDVATVFHAVSLYDDVTALPGDHLTVSVEGDEARRRRAGRLRLAVRREGFHPPDGLRVDNSVIRNSAGQVVRRPASSRATPNSKAVRFEPTTKTINAESVEIAEQKTQR